MQVNKNLSNMNYSTGNGTGRIKYIVIHYTGNNGDTAWGNTNYFKSVYRGASAHYFVDTDSIWQCVSDSNIAWHVGSDYYKHSVCRNSNSIGIEMCSRIGADGKYYIPSGTVANTVELTKSLMKTYGVPAENILRHYDVTGKICPEPFVREVSNWTNFIKDIKEDGLTSKEYEEINKRLTELETFCNVHLQRTLEQMREATAKVQNELTLYKQETARRDKLPCPDWAEADVKKAIEDGVLRGDGGTATPDTVRPQGYVTRAENVIMIDRAIDNAIKKLTDNSEETGK